MVDLTKRRTGKNAPQIVYPDIRDIRDQPSSGDRSKSGSKEALGDLDYGSTDAIEESRPYFHNQKDINKSETLVLPSPMLSF